MFSLVEHSTAGMEETLTPSPIPHTLPSKTSFGRQHKIETNTSKFSKISILPAPDTTAYGYRRSGVKLHCHLQKHDVFFQDLIESFAQDSEFNEYS